MSAGPEPSDPEGSDPVRPMPELRTDRMLLRDWRDEDLAPFAELNSDPIAMEHFPSTLTTAQSAEMIERLREQWASHGWSWWAVGSLESGEFLGAVGLLLVDLDAPFNDPEDPSIEVGWRLRRAAWGQGFATEAATAALDWAFGLQAAEEVVSFTAPVNHRSRRVMEKLGMRHDPDGDFDHQRVEPGSTLRRHVLYRLPRTSWPRHAPSQ
jgi:RimJ/RimL family protein N-acetyltransferase